MYEVISPGSYYYQVIGKNIERFTFLRLFVVVYKLVIYVKFFELKNRGYRDKRWHCTFGIGMPHTMQVNDVMWVGWLQHWWAYSPQSANCVQSLVEI